MNRSVLLVICDFLILTLLSFVQFETTEPVVGSAPGAGQEVSAPAMSNMVATLEAALEAERQRRSVLTNALAAREAELQQRLAVLAEREQRLSHVQDRLTQSEAEARRLAEERARLERSQSEAAASVQELQRAFEETRRNTVALQDRLSSTTREAAEAQARARLLEEELRRRQEESAEMLRRLAQMDSTRDSLASEKQELLAQLRAMEAEARQARQEASNLNQQLARASEEKAGLIQAATRLATNVGALTRESSAIREEVARQTEEAAAIREKIERDTRLPANAIYAGFLSNRVTVATAGKTRGAFGQEVVRRREADAVFVRSGGQVFAVLHVDSVPVRIWPPDAPWTAFSVELRRGNVSLHAGSFSLLRRDPRVVLVPVGESVASTLGVRVYEAASNPEGFADAVIIGGESAYYGESAYRLSPENPGYVEMERSSFRRLFGEFAPRRGDLAFTRTGQLLGIMVNSDRCLLMVDLATLSSFASGEGQDPRANSEILRTAHAVLERLPSRLR